MQMEGYITLAVSYETPTTYDTTNYNIVFVKKGDMTKFWVDFRQLLECIDSKTAQQQNEQNKITITGMAGENGGGGP
ncbi:MAG: hypothetical protein A2Y74_00375 [Actinobacteria bacterium RBG_13_63_9]|jgi:hypothetical protein|nr:MAG: hypothetical protein A2Y74_00375 [Actinobacteria bacterium RBG_13_63_9]